jgi:hypothetical protein
MILRSSEKKELLIVELKKITVPAFLEAVPDLHPGPDVSGTPGSDPPALVIVKTLVPCRAIELSVTIKMFPAFF